MSRSKLTVLCAALAAALSCGAIQAADAPAFKAGTYEAKMPGMHGDVVVKTTFSASRIEKVEVVKQTETQGIGTKAVEVLPGRIAEAQSTKIDGVSGATITSNAIRGAVDDCIRQAGADPLALVPLAVKKSAETKSLTTDVVIVGGGGAGMSATIRTRMNGLDAVLVEKMPFIGGAASISGGQVVAQGSKLQKHSAPRTTRSTRW